MDNKYQEINVFIKTLKSQVGNLTRQQLNTLKGQAIAGDLDGAKKGLKKLTLS
ncbi:MAG TPA: hypothetical protein VFD23_04245 [Clostridia bacterium]|nr:hypothetical protein [Clostridia bacterium]